MREAWYRVYSATRPRANAAIRELALDQPMTGSGVVLVEALWDHPYHWLRLAMLRRALSRRAGGLVGIWEEGTLPKVVASLRSLDLAAEETVARRVPERLMQAAQQRLAGLRTARDVLDMELPWGYPTCHLFDGMLKTEAIGTVTPDHPKAAAYFAKCLHYLEAYDAILDRHDVRAVILSHPSFPRFSTLAWCALRRGIPVYATIHVNEHVSARRFLSLSDFSGSLADRPDAAIPAILTPQQRERLIAVGQQYYMAVRSRQAGEFSIIDIYGKQALARREFTARVGCDPAKPNVVVMTSCWTDGPNSAGLTYFTDYQDLLEKTLAVISRVKECNWILRAHPAEFRYGNMRLANMVEGRLPDNVWLWPESVGAGVIPDVADCVVTPAGTAGVEYAAMGRRASFVATPSTPRGAS